MTSRSPRRHALLRFLGKKITPTCRTHPPPNTTQKEVATCPITHHPVNTPFTLNEVCYDADALAGFFLSTGDMRDPLTRVEITSAQVGALDDALQCEGSLVSFFENEARDVRRAHLERDEVLRVLEDEALDALEGVVDGDLDEVDGDLDEARMLTPLHEILDIDVVAYHRVVQRLKSSHPTISRELFRASAYDRF